MKLLFGCLAGVLLLGGCASKGLTEQTRSTLISDFIESNELESKRSVNAFRLDSWSVLSDYYLVLRSSPMRHYLVELQSRCDSLDYSFVVGIRQFRSNQLSAGTDYMFSPQYADFRCNIKTIYPISRDQQQTLIKEFNAAEKEAETEIEAAEAAD